MKTRTFWRASLSLFGAVAVAMTARSAHADSTIVLNGSVDAGGLDHFFLPFTVPAGTAEIQIEHSDAPSGNILDWGVNDENGYRGWGGGLTDTLTINAQAATRCYVPGPLTPGTWNVVVGKAKLAVLPVTYHVVITLRDAATLAPQTDRSVYQPVAALETTRRWYAGDFHTHSTESGDAGDSLDTLVTYAASVGLDFVEVSDHNTITQMDYFNGEQAKHRDILLVPGEEWTTYHGHGNGIGATKWVDHKIGQPGVTIQSALQGFQDQGAIFSINHPGLNIASLCIGCAWTFDGLDPTLIGGIEVESRAYDPIGQIISGPAVELFEDLSASGAHVAALGGSDDHQGGQVPGQSISNPTTYVLADELSVAGIMQGIRNRRTYVKLNGPSDPSIDFESSVEPVGDTVSAPSTVFTATVTGTGGAGQGGQLRWVKNGVLGDFIPITSDPFTATLQADASLVSSDPSDRVRAEVFVNGDPTTVTSYLWLKNGAAASVPPPSPAASSGCSATPAMPGTPRSVAFGLFALTALGVSRVLGARRRERR